MTLLHFIQHIDTIAMDTQNNKTISNNATHTSDNVEQIPDQCESSEILKPHAHDILFGCGNNINRHIGNVFLLQLAAQRKQHYKDGTHNGQRLMVAYEIFGEIKKLDPPGRFLMPTPHDSSKWYDISDPNAIREICQLLVELGNEEIASPSQKPEFIISDTYNPQNTVDRQLANNGVTSNSFNLQANPVHSINASNGVPRPFSAALNINQSRMNIANEFKQSGGKLNPENSFAGQVNSDNNDQLTLELIKRYKSAQKHNLEALDVKSSNIDSELVSAQAANRNNVEDYNVVERQQRLTNQLPMMQDSRIVSNTGLSNLHMLNHALDRSNNGNSTDGKHQYFKPNSLSPLEQNPSAIDPKKSISTKKKKVSLPKIDDDQLSGHSSMQSNSTKKPEIKSKSESDSVTKCDKPRDANSTAKRHKSTHSESVKEPKVNKMESDHHQQVIMPLSYIGHSFMNSADCSYESKCVFEEIAYLGQRTKGDALLYLPSIIGSLCKRVMELEEKTK